MVFSDKLKALMEITGTSNKTLANHLIVDPSLISQLRTGARNVTKKNVHVKNMAFYFAEKCMSSSKMLALYELIQNDELKNSCSVTRLNDIIYEFLMSDTVSDNSDDSGERSSYGMNAEIFKSNPRIRKSELIPYEISDNHFMVCRNIEEKKEYMKKLFEYFLTLKSPEIIYFSSEEIIDWIYNDAAFYNDFRSWCLTLTERGFSIVRIMKPMENKEHFLENILLWVPMYMTGRVHLYYYPHFRDDIFRQTIIAVDRVAAYFSSSIARTNTCYYSFFSTEQTLSTAYVHQVKDYLAFCKPSFYLCKTEQNIASAFSKLMSLPGDRISKSFNLSPESIPYEEMVEYLSSSDLDIYRQAAENVKRLYVASGGSDEEDIVIDICTLASAQDVRDGKVRLLLPGSVNRNPVYYNADLYVIHLKHILHMLETNSNYYFYPIEPSEFGEYGDDYHPVSAVDHRTVLLVSDDLVLHFVQPDIIHTLYERLYNEAKAREKYSEGREAIIEKIRRLLEQLSK